MLFRVFDKLHLGVQTAGHKLPLIVGRFLVVDVNDIDFLHLAPLNPPAVQVGNAVGRKIGDFYA